MSSSEAQRAGLRGKALRITHYYRDFLWQVSWPKRRNFFKEYVINIILLLFLLNFHTGNQPKVIMFQMLVFW